MIASVDKLMAVSAGTLLIRNASILVTMDEQRREIPRGGMFIRNGMIEQAGDPLRLPTNAETVVDLDNHVVLPGFINGHHHLYQTFDRACPACQNASLVSWLKGLYPRWVHLTPDDVRLATEIGLAELVLSGCTTVCDHHYIHANGSKAEDSFEIAARIGIRFHLGRGFQNVGAPDGGVAPTTLLERDDDVLAECERLIHEFHDASVGSFRQVFVAPGSLRSVTPRLVQESAALSEKHMVPFHMHLGETRGEIAFCVERFGKRPVEVADELGCLSPRSWFAHGVHFNEGDIDRLARSGSGICHCPSSNMRLSSGIAPIGSYLAHGLRVGLGVDGSASNDSSNLLAEIRMALLLARVGASEDKPLLAPRCVLEMATVKGAELVGRQDIGSLTPGYAADFIAIDLDRLELLGAEDPVGALALCAMTRVDHAWVHGKPVVKDGMLTNVDTANLAARYRSMRRRESEP